MVKLDFNVLLILSEHLFFSHPESIIEAVPSACDLSPKPQSEVKKQRKQMKIIISDGDFFLGLCRGDLAPGFVQFCPRFANGASIMFGARTYFTAPPLLPLALELGL